jgi:hypothetical protein
VPDIQRLRRKYSDWLLTLLTALLALMIFVFAPRCRQRAYLRFQGLAIAGLLVIIGGVTIISASPTALALMCVAVVTNVAVFVLRLFHPLWSYNLYLLAAAWLIIATTLGTIVAGAVFRRGRITYHRIVGAVLLYLLVAVGFAALFAFVGLSIPDAFKGIVFEDDAALARAVLPKFCNPDDDWLRRYRADRSDRKKCLQYRSRSWSTLSGYAFSEARNA